MANPSKAKGTTGEKHVCEYLRRETGMDVQRLALSGTQDKGDLWGVKFHGWPVVVEVKKCVQQKVVEWWRETLREMDNASTPYGVLVSVEPGTGKKSIGRAKVWCDLKRFRALATCSNARPKRGDNELVYMSLSAFAELVDHK